MRGFLIFFLCCSLAGQAQQVPAAPARWHMTGNKWLTGSFVFTAGLSKGFNETLMFHWPAFHKAFPHARATWFNPKISWMNKYKGNDPDAGAKFPLSTSVLVMFTDQYHFDNFVNKLSWTSALVLHLGEKKKPLRHYLMDLLYYSVCHQAGFALAYYPFKHQ